MTDMDRLFDYRSTRDAARGALREAVVAAALGLLGVGGARALTVRDLAAAVGASTKVVYSHFGGMPGVMAALYDHGFALLADRLAAADDDPAAPLLERLRAIAHAYRGFALEQPELFALMFGARSRFHWQAQGHDDPSARALARIETVFAPVLADGGPAAALRFWSRIHGPVALEIAGWIDGPELIDAAIAEFMI